MLSKSPHAGAGDTMAADMNIDGATSPGGCAAPFGLRFCVGHVVAADSRPDMAAGMARADVTVAGRPLAAAMHPSPSRAAGRQPDRRRRFTGLAANPRNPPPCHDMARRQMARDVRKRRGAAAWVAGRSARSVYGATAPCRTAAGWGMSFWRKGQKCCRLPTRSFRRISIWR